MFTVDDLIFIQGHLGSYQLHLEKILENKMYDNFERVKRQINHITEINNKIDDKLKAMTEDVSDIECMEESNMNNLRKIYFHKIYDKQKEFQRPGYFHKWVTYASDEGSEEFALVEDLDGNIIETYTTYIKFFNDPNATFVNIK